MPRLNLLRHHRRSSNEQSSKSTHNKPSTTPPPQIPPPEILPPLNIGSGSPTLGTPDTWLTPTTAPDSTPRSRTPTEPVNSPKKTRKSAEKERKQQNAPSPPAPKDKRKLTLLNPMSLLSRRRSSQSAIEKQQKTARDLPDDFDPGIIYGTRHPDWSSGPRRGGLLPVNRQETGGKELLKVEVVTKDGNSHGFKEHFEDEKGIEGSIIPNREKEREQQRSLSDAGPQRPPMTSPPSPPMKAPPPPPTLPKDLSPSPPASTKEAVAPVPPIVETAPEEGSDNEGELHSPPDGRPRVTLFDHPLSLPHHLINNSSRFSFEGSSAAGESTTHSNDNLSLVPRVAPDFDPDDSDAEMDMDDIDMDDEDDDGFERANEAIFGEGEEYEGSDDDDDDDDGLVMALQPMSIGLHPMSIGLSVPEGESSQHSTIVSPEGDYTDETEELPTMDPNPSAVVPYIGVGGEVPLRKRIGNPRGYDLDEDSDLDFLEEKDGNFGNGIEGYEDEEDDMYFDDGIIMDPTPQDISQYVTAPDTALATPLGASNPLLPEDQRLSLSTVGVSSGGAMMVEDGSMSGTHGSTTNGGGSGAENRSFPPFINPIGGGLGFTQEHAQFYAPDGTMLDGNGCPLALSTLTQSLHAYQKEQQRRAEEEEGQNDPLNGYESDYNYTHSRGESQSGYYSDGYEEDDETMVAAANAEALAYDTEFYGQEFGFYPAPPSSASDTSEAAGAYGGYFGPPGGEVLQRPPLLRRPSLTPISERSESSWRNSAVFPVEGWKGLGAQRPLSALSFGGGGEETGGDGSLDALMKLRRGAWGGSNGSIKSSLAGTGGGNSPVAPPPGWGVMGGAAGNPNTNGSGGSPGVLPGSPLASAGGFVSCPPGLTPPPGLSPPPGLGFPSSQGLSLPPGLSPPPGLPLPPGLSPTPGLSSPPPGLSHPGANAMLPTKGSFDEQQLLMMQGRQIMQMQMQMQMQNSSPEANNDFYNQNQGMQVQTQTQQPHQKAPTVDSSYASAVGSPVDTIGQDEEEKREEVEKWVFNGRRVGSRGSRGS